MKSRSSLSDGNSSTEKKKKLYPKLWDRYFLFISFLLNRQKGRVKSHLCSRKASRVWLTLRVCGVYSSINKFIFSLHLKTFWKFSKSHRFTQIRQCTSYQIKRHKSSSGEERQESVKDKVRYHTDSTLLSLRHSDTKMGKTWLYGVS